MPTRTISRFMIGQSRNWSEAASWEEGMVPHPDDNVVARADHTSGDLIIDPSIAECRSIDLSNYTGSITHLSGKILKVGDSGAGTGNVALKSVAGMGYTAADASSQIKFVSSVSNPPQSIDFGSKTTGDVVFDRETTAGAWQLALGSSHMTTGTVTLTWGSLALNNATCTWAAFSSNNSNTRTFDLGSAAVTITSGGGVKWGVNGNGLTLLAGTSTIKLHGDAVIVYGGTLAYNTMEIMGAGVCQIIDPNTFQNLKRSPPNVRNAELSLGGNQTINGTLTLQPQTLDSQYRFLVHSSLLGQARTLTVNGTASLSYVDFQDIAWSGVAFSGTSIGDCQGNSGGIVGDPPVTRFWVLGSGFWHETGHWSDSSGGPPNASIRYLRTKSSSTRTRRAARPTSRSICSGWGRRSTSQPSPVPSR